jgi:hypothetical protein
MKVKNAEPLFIVSLFLLHILLGYISVGYGDEPSECYGYFEILEWNDLTEMKERVKNTTRIPPIVSEDLHNRAMKLELIHDGFYAGTGEECRELDEHFDSLGILQENKVKKKAEWEMYEREFDEYETECVHGSPWRTSDCEIWRKRLEGWREELKMAITEIDKKELIMKVLRDSIVRRVEKKIMMVQEELEEYLHDAEGAVLNSRLDVLNEEISDLQMQIKNEGSELEKFKTSLPSFLHRIREWSVLTREEQDEVIENAVSQVATYLMGEYLIEEEGGKMVSEERVGDVEKIILNSWNSQMREKFSSEIEKLLVPQEKKDFAERVQLILKKCDSIKEKKNLLSLIGIFTPNRIRSILEEGDIGISLVYSGYREGKIKENLQHIGEQRDETIQALLRISREYLEHITLLKEKENEKGVITLELIDIE